ncbi:MAG: class III extradiol ring-cleavage dioxygenase [Steroidobacteraceae bacterium]
MSPRLPVLFISHGGGPWPYVEELRAMYPQTERELRGLAQRLPSAPKAVLTISGHWEAPKFSVATGARPTMEYDYFGFPPNTYHVRYDAPGDPGLAREVLGHLREAGIDALPDQRKGFDHGVFVPLGLIYPDANVPVTMVSIRSDYSPAEHLALGRALAPLREQGVLIIASGLTYHNMQGFRQDSSTAVAESFTGYLNAAMAQEPATRMQRLIDWESAPCARLAHPREDHLVPLFVAVGAAGEDAGEVLFSENVLKVPMTSYLFGAIA